MSSATSILKQYWGYDSFRPGQAEIIDSILSGKDTLAILPTGGGKSICYQVPALLRPGLCLVISPLIALMRDQVENLRKRGITAYAIHTGMSRGEVINILTVAGESNCKLLYVSPERLNTALFQEFLPGLNIQFIAVDEAHCISQWGYDFRPAYLRIAELRPQLPDAPILALTASATPAIQDDICLRLTPEGSDASRWKRFRNSFERSNLSYSVLSVPAKLPRLRQILEKLDGTGIIYCRSRKATESVAQELSSWGVSAEHYHAGLTMEQRRERETNWMQGTTRVMTCTNAFGMGIDKPDVRFVVHYDATESLENYYQEAGRAGRDEKRAYAILLNEPSSMQELEERSRLQFPSLDEVRKIYQSVANYLQVPIGVGEGQFVDFDPIDFRKKFKHDSYSLQQAFALLEENQWLSYNEEVFFPPTVRVLADRDELERFERERPREMELIKTLLRQYGGIRDRPVGISELVLAKALRVDKERIGPELIQLHRSGHIEYQPRKDRPQIQWLQPRASATEIKLNAERYEFRKREAAKRLAAMLNYLKETNACRSQWIGQYFGDPDLKACGICDNCIERKKRAVQPDPIQLQERLLILLEQSPMDWLALQQQCADIPADRLQAALHFLMGEGRIGSDDQGQLRSN